MPLPIIIALLLLCSALLAACNPATRPIDIQFDVRFDGEAISCQPSASGRALTDLRFFIHDVVLTTDQGRAVRLVFSDDGIWQGTTVAMLDFEDGSGACVNGTGPVNTRIQGGADLAPDDTVVDLSFRIGVPEALNHANPMLAAAPLAYTIMHWHWRSGYKFMRVGVENANDLAWLHLGSSKCSGTIGNIEGCAAENRPVVRLDNFAPSADAVVIDIARLLGPSLLGDGLPWSCESGADEQHCQVVFAELGLDFASGETLGPAPAFYKVQR